MYLNLFVSITHFRSSFAVSENDTICGWTNECTHQSDHLSCKAAKTPTGRVPGLTRPLVQQATVISLYINVNSNTMVKLGLQVVTEKYKYTKYRNVYEQ